MRRPPYAVMSSDEIAALPVKYFAADDSLLFIWTTDYHLEKCLKVINSWGFTYKTIGFVWQKLNKQNSPVCFMGAYTMKSGVENCLLATRGDARKLLKANNIRALVQSQRQRHSKKPDEVRDRITALVGLETSKIELFARENFDGWDCWGDESSVSYSVDLLNPPKDADEKCLQQ